MIDTYKRVSIDHRCYAWAQYEYTIAAGYVWKWYFYNTHINVGSGTICRSFEDAKKAVDEYVDKWEQDHYKGQN